IEDLGKIHRVLARSPCIRTQLAVLDDQLPLLVLSQEGAAIDLHLDDGPGAFELGELVLRVLAAAARMADAECPEERNHEKPAGHRCLLARLWAAKARAPRVAASARRVRGRDKAPVVAGVAAGATPQRGPRPPGRRA